MRGSRVFAVWVTRTVEEASDMLPECLSFASSTLSLETGSHFSKYCYLIVFQLSQMSGFSFLNLLWWRLLLKLDFLALKVSMGESTFHTETWHWLDGEMTWGSFQATDWGVLLGLPGAMERGWCNTVWGSQAFPSESCFLLINIVNITFTYKNVWLISWHGAESEF